MKIIIFSLFFLSIFSHNNNKCQNSTDYKYDLINLESTSGYYSVCSEHASRTCCSRDNFQNSAKKILKTIGPQQQLSFKCKRKLIDGLCSSCDGDVGIGLKNGVCRSFCQQIFDFCRQDLFTIDSNNQIRICRQEDIICSKLEDILTQKQSDNICKLLGLSYSDKDCWNGQISAHTKGKITKSSPTINKKSNDKKNKTQQKPKKQKNNNKKQSIFNQQLINYLGLFLLLAFVFSIFWIKKSYKQWKKYFNRK